MQNNININSYLGQKGYTLLKKELTIEQQKQIRNDLTIKPYTGSIGANNSNPVTYPAYRESDKKFYVPHYYGVETFGKPKEHKISEGENIDVDFVGILRDYQEPVVKKYIDCVTNSGFGGGGLLELPCGFGKCLGKGTKLMLSNGSFELVENIKVGDLLMGDDSTPRKVLSLSRGREQMYKISSKKGDEYICNESHILSLKYSTNLSKKIRKGDIIDISVKDFLDLPKSYHGKGGPLLGYKTQIKFKHQDVDFDPYLFGYWLGDGSSRDPVISTQEGCIIKYIVDLFKNNYTDLYLRYHSQYDYRICSLKRNNRFMTFLRKNNLLNNKHIPYEYKYNRRDIQLKLLAGLIDSDGYNKTGCYEIMQKNNTLAEDIVYLCRSLGFACYSRKSKKTCYNSKNGPKEGIYNRISIYGTGIEEIPLLCKRKQNPQRKQIKNALVYRIKVEKISIDDYYGFEIDGNRRFVLGDFSVTHNTSIGLNLVSQLKKKTLVIVHKEFLLNQWVERIEQFLPTARVGRIQGQIIDIENKDIVIGMLQSLSMKEYPASVFESFGFTIIDEVHHISSQTFSNALFKIITKYMLGLSATMNRKDGTTRVFKMFLGDVIFKGKRDEERNVEVRAITYKVNDDEFNDTILDYRGNTQNSSMISKLCEYNRRSEFIIKTVCDFIKVDNVDDKTITNHKLLMDSQVPNCEMCNKNNNYLVHNTCCDCVKYCLTCIENIDLQSQTHSNEKTSKKTRTKCPNCKKILKYEQNYIENPYVKPLEQNHTIIMSHNLNILHYMYKKFVCKNLASVGYYIGGMSEDELKKSGTKQVIFSSYSMSSEGLDIPTLNSQFLITPKSDIVQIVGRILRAKHTFSHPIIYDFIDTHDIFQRQWFKRKSYYKSQNYKIIGSNSIDYNDNFNTWKTIYEPNIEKKNKPACNLNKGTKKQISSKSNSSSDKSIAVDSDESDDEEEKLKRNNSLTGKCFISIKK
jgi:superfamily II DNA or RNA helicase